MKLSIIVPVYNVYEYLERCLDSLVNQTIDNYEIIVINDGTKDNSETIILKYLGLYPNLIKYYVKENGGLSDARNYGLKYAKGEYIGFIDSDDYIDQNMYLDMYKKIKEENSDLCECDFYWVYNNKKVLDKNNYYNSEHFFLQIRVVSWNKLYKRSIINENNILFPVGLRYEDIAFTYEYLKYVKKYSYVDKPYYYYIQRGNSISNNQNIKVTDIFKILNIVKESYEENIEYNEQMEYLFTKILLGSSFLRILKIKNKRLRKSILDENWKFLNKYYPNFRNNIYLSQIKSKKNKYYKTVNNTTYKIYSIVFRYFKV